MMWGAVATALAALIPALVQIWGPPSPLEWDALVKACDPLPSPGPADKTLAEIEADMPRSTATTVKVPVTGKDVAP